MRRAWVVVLWVVCATARTAAAQEVSGGNVTTTGNGTTAFEAVSSSSRKRGKWRRRTRRWFLRLRPSKHMGARGALAMWLVLLMTVLAACVVFCCARREAVLPLLRTDCSCSYDCERLAEYRYRALRCCGAALDGAAFARDRCSVCCVFVTLCFLRKCCGHTEVLKVYDDANRPPPKAPRDDEAKRRRRRRKRLKKQRRLPPWYAHAAEDSWARRLPQQRLFDDVGVHALPPLPPGDRRFSRRRRSGAAAVGCADHFAAGLPSVVAAHRALNEAALNGLPFPGPPPTYDYPPLPSVGGYPYYHPSPSRRHRRRYY